jgi:hypothetical protein
MLTPTDARLQREAFEQTRVARTEIMALPKIVAVIFPGNSTEYSYHCDIPDVQQGDYVIVASPSGPDRYDRNQNFFSPELKGYPTVVRVVRTQETVKDVSKASKWVIQKLDIDKYVERLAYEQQVDVLKAKIKRAKEEALERAQLATLRALSPELEQLVTELATLTGVPIEEKPVEVRRHQRKRTVRASAKAAPAKKAKTASPRRTKAK